MAKRPVKLCSTSLIFWKCKPRTQDPTSHPLGWISSKNRKPVFPTRGDMNSHTAGGMLKRCSHCRNQDGGSLINTGLPYDATIPLLRIHPEDLTAGTQISASPCSQQHYSQVKTWKHPKYPPIEGWMDGQMNKMGPVHPYSGILSSLKKEIPTDATTGVSLEDIIPREISHSQKDKY